MNDPAAPFVDAALRYVRHGRYTTALAETQTMAELEAAAKENLRSKSPRWSDNTVGLQASSLLLEILDQCGHYQQTEELIHRHLPSPRDVLKTFTTRAENVHMRLKNRTFQWKKEERLLIRAQGMLLLQMAVATQRSGRYQGDAESWLTDAIEAIGLMRSDGPRRGYRTSGLESLIRYWQGRGELSFGHNQAAATFFEQAMQGAYQGLVAHAEGPAKTANEIADRLSSAQYQVASCLAFGLARVLELQGRISDAQALLWPAAVVFVGQSDTFRQGYVSLMIGGTVRALAGRSDYLAQTIQKDLETALHFQEKALTLFQSDGGHCLHEARAHHHLSVTRLTQANVCEVSETPSFLKSAWHEHTKATELLDSLPERFQEPLFSAGLHTVASRVLLLMGNDYIQRALDEARTAQALLQRSSLTESVHYPRARMAEANALQAQGRDADALHIFGDCARVTGDPATKAMAELQVAQINSNHGHIKLAREILSKISTEKTSIQSVWVHLKARKLEAELPGASEIRLDLETIRREAATGKKSIWRHAQRELARQLLTHTATDEEGNKLSQEKQAERLGIDRGYISRLRKDLKLNSE